MSKTDYSLECESCGLYNLEDGVIEKGKIYCLSCHDKIEEKRRKWRYYKKFKVKRVPIKLERKDGEKIIIFGRKVTLRKSK